MCALIILHLSMWMFEVQVRRFFFRFSDELPKILFRNKQHNIILVGSQCLILVMRFLRDNMALIIVVYDYT